MHSARTVTAVDNSHKSFNQQGRPEHDDTRMVKRL